MSRYRVKLKSRSSQNTKKVQRTPSRRRRDSKDSLDRFKVFHGSMGGIEEWLTDKMPLDVKTRLLSLSKNPIGRSQLNQLLLLSHEAGMSYGFFQYYWLHVPLPDQHPYDVTKIEGFPGRAVKGDRITSLDHLYWGFYRLYVDALLCFGNVRYAYRYLREMPFVELEAFFHARSFDLSGKGGMLKRGHALKVHNISKDDRYLISEMACKSFQPADGSETMSEHLIRQYHKLREATKRQRFSFKELIDGAAIGALKDRQNEFQFSANEFLDEVISSEAELLQKYDQYKVRFDRAREMALKNTELFLSMVNDLDVYVATSMRYRQDFRDMADFCTQVFGSAELKDLYVRYFDPTVSAADGHEDKGLIECLMVKSAKALLYFAGDRDSFGKDAETAMALSLGKPVVIYSKNVDRARLFRDVHPLTRLIDFRTGVAVGAMVTNDITLVPRLLRRILRNEMEYELVQPKPDYLQLKEKLTSCVVRIQTNNALLRETFWNHYHAPV